MAPRNIGTLLSVLGLWAGCGAPHTTGADEADFVTTFGVEFFARSTDCDPDLARAVEVSDKSGCFDDAQAASASVAGAWTCNAEFADFEYVEAPAACSAVWDCAVARR